MACSILLITVGRCKDDAAILLQILGWSARLMQCYEQASPIKEPKQADKLSEGQTVKVKITTLGADGSPKMSNSQVSYEPNYP